MNTNTNDGGVNFVIDEILPPTNDWIFKLLFGDERNKSLLISLLGSFLELPDEEYDIIFLDPHLKPETAEGKLGILDVKIKTKSGKIIDIEIQVNPADYIGKRISFYKSKLIVEQAGKGEDYDTIQQVICVCITDYVLFHGTKDYVNSFAFYNTKNGLRFDEIPEEVYTLEIPKIPENSDGSGIYQWLRFLSSRKKEEFEMVAEQNPEIRKAADTLYELSSDEDVRAQYEWREKCIRDHTSYTNYRVRMGIKEGIKQDRQEILELINQGISIEELKKHLLSSDSD